MREESNTASKPVGDKTKKMAEKYQEMKGQNISA